MSIRKISAMLCGVFAVGVLAFAAEDKTKPFKASCPVSGQPAKEDKTVDYKGGKVYFCCGECPGAFKKDIAKFATKANHQLAATGQTTQVKCPLSGAKLNPDANVEVAGVKVGFCCEKCVAKTNDTKGEAQVDLVFAEGPFAKAFEVKK